MIRAQAPSFLSLHSPFVARPASRHTKLGSSTLSYIPFSGNTRKVIHDGRNFRIFLSPPFSSELAQSFRCKTGRRIPAPSPSLAFRNVQLQSCVTPLKQRRSKNPRLRLVNAVEEETQVSQQQSSHKKNHRRPTSNPLLFPFPHRILLPCSFRFNVITNHWCSDAVEETDHSISYRCGFGSGRNLQGSGFKLQTLNLSFEDEEDAAA